MGKSFYKTEKEKIKALIKLPLLELVLQFLPHLQPSAREKDDTWEVVAIQLGHQRFSETIGKKKSIEEVESMPEFNGFFIREIFEEIYENFKKSIIFREMPIDRKVGDSINTRMLVFNPVDRVEALLYTIHEMRYVDIVIMANISRENLEKSFRTYLKHEVEHELPSHEIVQQYKKSVEVKRNEILKEEISKKDKRLEQLTQENKRLLELNHELLSQSQGQPK